MIKCKLYKLMGDKKLKIQDIHEETGLNRNTIANLYHEKATRIDFETIAKLCMFFDCPVSDILEYVKD